MERPILVSVRSCDVPIDPVAEADYVSMSKTGIAENGTLQ